MPGLEYLESLNYLDFAPSQSTRICFSKSISQDFDSFETKFFYVFLETFTGFYLLA